MQGDNQTVAAESRQTDAPNPESSVERSSPWPATAAPSLRDSASHAGQGAQSVPQASPSRTRRREAGPSLPHATRRRRTSDMIICQGAEKLGAGGEGAAGGGGRRTAAFVFRFGRPRRTHRSRRVGVDVSASLFLSDHRRQPHCHARCHRAGMGKATHRRAFCGSLRDDSVADFAARSRLPPGSAPLPHKQRDGCHRVCDCFSDRARQWRQPMQQHKPCTG